MKIEVLADADSVARADEESRGLKTNQRTGRRDKHRRFLEQTFRQAQKRPIAGSGRGSKLTGSGHSNLASLLLPDELTYGRFISVGVGEVCSE